MAPLTESVHPAAHPTARQHHIDALRALAFGLLILYHIAMLYVHDWGWHLKSSYQSELLQIPMLLVNRWRMDLIFLISGVATAIMLTRATRAGQPFLRERSKRLLLPLLFGVLVIVPLQPYCQGVANGLVEPGFLTFLGRYFTGYAWPPKAFDGWEHGFTWNHLWYLVYVYVYTVLIVLLLWLKGPLGSAVGQRISAAVSSLSGTRLMIWPFVPILAFTLLLALRFPQKNNLTSDWYAHSIYFTMFLYGWWIGQHDQLWRAFAAIRRRALVVALISWVAYMVVRELVKDDTSFFELFVVWVFRSLYIWTMLAAILGYGLTHLNRPFRWLGWANRSVFPWYLLHQSLIVLIAYWLVPMKLGAPLEVFLVLAGTIGGCFVITELVARIGWLRPLFGMKR